ncbi:O-succinylbenzoic acid--CoA ligase [Pectobacterium atrosepticum SCRI1043]|uniref:O-succinylbenzoic acid--CoA ligase n=1 Tax=Pectobacterium atrosepticum (strain SCRI 1043 / ATCC BAA-672) TaxID=218491 RepID=Q6D7W0_PECAS|nr:o-succinylbenzoate--CoA ligase [Pectobacterium atrosepticum]GKV86394.1 2-succinylbenzoate-CoA ligase [Pectobacterium carotovorum subsp. carotovorum]AIA70172.1 O-succinylbenzoic acid--CoA ligase [Pectobacterium atrosepticum]AIK13093.1 O-succinylbenzoic acid--CoA ligase [Pectobacterium atrosepticum]ATY90006.1 o-succinylbenzoate--CoA ligase [Pectobacterium atrosepticum]KFX16918.1 O-succinylbenzoic acid--CoA ligase [Pectobacterium atrosepticum]
MAILTDWPWRYWASQTPQPVPLNEPVALIDDETRWSWQMLAQRVDRLAEHFAQQGVTAESTVALRGKNSVPMLCSYLALLQCGARALPLNPQLPDTLTEVLLPALNVACGLCLNDKPWPDSVRTLSLPSASSLSGDIEETIDTNRLRWQDERLATLTLTSGSSGMPKAVAHTFSAHISSAEGVVQMMAFSASDSWLLSLPLFHVSGQGIIWRWLATGATIVVRAHQPLDTALRDCTHASLVPTQLWRLLSEKAFPEALKAVLLGGAMIPQTLTQQAEARGVSCWCGYGLTELASTVCAKRADGRSGVGMPLLGREIQLVDDEILLRGSTLAAGYWRDGKLIPLVDDDGWFHTRDRGLFTEGEWHIQGRLDNQFFSGGEGVQPENIEAVLLTHPAVQQACIVPVEDVEFGHRPVAVLEVVQTTTLDAVRDWLQPQLAGFQRPVAYYALPAELKNGGIKLSRQQVKNWVKATYPQPKR